MRTGFLILILSASISLANAEPQNQKNEILAELNAAATRVETVKASLQVGIPHPTAALVQWTEALVAYRKNPEFLYLKGYQPLVPLYFLLKSDSDAFSLFVPRVYKVFRGKNKIFDTSIDIDIALIPQDIILALKPLRINDTDHTEWKLAKDQTAFELTVKDKEGKILRKIIIDSSEHVRYQVEYNDAGFPYLEIWKDDWRDTGSIFFPYEIKMKRSLPKKNELVLKFKEIRPNEKLEEKLFQDTFPKDAEVVELKESSG
ncbi:MAG: hypothetical protein A3E74_08530 [Omnitrophica bacterium RIFCSPHIGHO2_12_FULL_44_12]|nr:MAG: hypothetical protein A3B72_09520 [Omnitrophica bacterium RIFCSPHIGHO2_02_FULL_45_28]OGW89315.1 MAG: hypothetical protein A3E74_08530 [Omnitrophica bacterium RIFCSPHIGHO2_12_FULL_44_12]